MLGYPNSTTALAVLGPSLHERKLTGATIRVRYRGRPAPSAAMPVLFFYLLAQKWVFRPTWATRCPDKHESWHGGADQPTLQYFAIFFSKLSAFVSRSPPTARCRPARRRSPQGRSGATVDEPGLRFYGFLSETMECGVRAAASYISCRYQSLSQRGLSCQMLLVSVPRQ